MTHQHVSRKNQQSKSDTPLASGILQRAAVRNIPEKDVQPTQEVEATTLGESRFHHNFCQVPVSTGTASVIQAKGLMQGQVHKENKTGLPDNLKAGIENLSGMAMDDVRVHYNSYKPPQLQALAYTQGTDIHVSPGQEKHLPHEAWHVVQQAQGRVQPTMLLKDEVPVNGDGGLEQEADVMGAKALQMKPKADKSRLVANSIIQKKSNPVQRAIIAHGTIDGLTRDMDTSDKATSKVQIWTMWNGGKIAGLAQLRTALGAVNPEQYKLNNLALRAEIWKLLNKPPWLDPNAGVASNTEKATFDAANPPGDETGITQQPGQGEVLPANPTLRQTYALNVRSWQIGDIADGIGWSQLGAHLQGRMKEVEYVELGDDILRLHDLRNGANLQNTTSDDDKSLIAKQSLARVRNEIRGGLDGLPKKPGVSYRAADSAVGVYGRTINVGDYIKDMSFWSTSGLKLSHKNIDFGSEGTLAKPKVYYIIKGSTGVFVPRFTNKETNVREVLFKDQTIFRVNKITNYADRTFFVHVEEQDPTQLPLNQATKNPWSGANNP